MTRPNGAARPAADLPRRKIEARPANHPYRRRGLPPATRPARGPPSVDTPHAARAADRLSPAAAVALHLLPGTLTMAALLALTPPLLRAGGTPTLAYQLAAGLVLIPVMAGVTAWHARRTTGRADPRAVVGNRGRPPAWVYPAVLVPMLAWAFGVFFAYGPAREVLARDVFGWLPPYLLPGWRPAAPPDRGLLLAALVLQLLVDGVVAPVAEEAYFRGFLLPRLSGLGAWAPLVSTALFTIHHWWQPYNWPQIFLIMLPLVYLAWWRQSWRLSAAMHAAGNTIGALIALAEFAA